jgi:hypothetical protein
MSIDYKAIAESELLGFKSEYKPINDIKYAIFTMGIPASGKSSSVSYILREIGIPVNSVVQLDPDDIMTRLDGYSDRLTIAQKTKFNRAAIIITSKILDSLIAEGISFVYFGTGRSHQSYSRYMRKTIKNDFINVLINVELDLEEAIRRNSKRNRSLGRNIITNINTTLKLPIKEGKPDTRLDQYQKLCDLVYSVNTLTKPPQIKLLKSKDSTISTQVEKTNNGMRKASARSKSANARSKSANARSVTSTRKANRGINTNTSRSSVRSTRKRKTVKYTENSSVNSTSNSN